MANPLDFVTQYGPVAAQVGQRLGVDPRIVLGQWGLETGWGNSVIPGTNNLGNIKDVSGGGVSAVDNMTGSNDSYRRFDSPQDFGNHYADLIARKYPAALMAGRNASAFATALKQGGYAEDPDYVNKLTGAAITVAKQPRIMDRISNLLVPAAQADTLGSIFPSSANRPASVNATAWKDVIAKPEYKALSPEDKAAAQEQYFNDVVSPQVPKELINDAHNQFLNQYPTQPKQDNSLTDSVARQVGLTARGAIQGITAIPEMVWNGLTGVPNQYAGTNIPKANITPALDAIGLPKPNRPTEQFAQKVVGAMVPTAGIAKAAEMIGSGLTGAVGKGVADILSAAPTMQTISAGIGAGAGDIAEQKGADPLLQETARLAGGFSPAALRASGGAVVRGLLRGTSPETMQANIQAFNQAGTTPTIGQAAQMPRAQALEGLLSRVPGGAGVMQRKAIDQADEISNSVNDLAARLSGNAGAVNAGESVSSGLLGFKSGVKDLQRNLYDSLDSFMPKATPITVDRTKDALTALNADINGAPALSQMFKNGRIQGIEGALGSDLALSPGSTLPYESIKKLRTLVGNEIDNTNFASDVPRDKWSALYSALSNDLGDAATKAGPDAAAAWQWANQFTHGQMGRLEGLSSVMGKDSPEKIFQAAMAGTNEGDTILKRVVSAIPKENRKDLAATVISRMGRATPGNQNDLGDVFSTQTFLTNWNKLSPEAKQTLFGRIGDAETMGTLNNLANVAANIKTGSRVFTNPSGTGSTLLGSGLLSSGIYATMSGNWPLLAGVLAVPGASYGAARAATEPRLLNMLANPTRLSQGYSGGLLGSVPMGTPAGN
ncbi:glycoside hydrolase family 73 protein [Paralcaligenes ureilyticus]|uniref:Mannosyl-glycoprotein endo-beta-N-acetylglucosaminidase n=1 Tax=Paralcaligenes ureilyticus TaxID=627131 RepID=A0A4R3M8M9_9BURK|nr:glucosaminidase domain-containing protein [Paralcaligenes ureilyticus]TCT09486.1 mannosyl-glycoprotein endo-beta-N-acetylglucosaminidase [Paralcaligenes ureilyticus]